MATNRAIVVTTVLSTVAHVALLAAPRAPLRGPEPTSPLRLWIETLADHDVKHEEVGAVARPVAPDRSRSIVADEPRENGRPTDNVASGQDAAPPSVAPLLADASDELTVRPRDMANMIATIADSVRVMPAAERQMLEGRVKKWSSNFDDAKSLDTHATWMEQGRRYTADWQRLPVTDDMDFERVIVEITTEEDGQLLKSRMQMKQLAFSNFTQLVDRWDPAVQLHDDEIVGRFHSNSELMVGWDRETAPRFLGQVTMAARNFVIASATNNRARSDIFRGGLETDAAPISFPKRGQLFADRRLAADAHVVSFDRDSQMTFYADGSVGSRAIGSDEPEQRIRVRDTTLYVIGAPKTTLVVQGIVSGTVLVYSPEDIVIAGSITYGHDPRTPGDSSDYLGLAADKNVVIAGPDVTGPGDLRIDAAIYARRRFVVRDLDGSGQATLIIYGSLSAGSISATEPRYATKLEFDRRFERVRPPGFPMTDRYELEEWDEHWERVESESPIDSAALAP